MEFKFHDLNIDDAIVATSGTVSATTCVGIAQGTGESERIGRKIMVAKLMWRYEIQLPNTTDANDTHDDVRMVLYVDFQCNGATAAVDDIIVSRNYQSFYKRQNRDRFAILFDETVSMRAQSGMATNGYGEVSETGEFEVDLNLPIEFSGTSGAITGITSANIGFFAISGSGLAGLNSKMRILFSG